MKIYAYYDSDGTIHSLVCVNAPEGVGLMLAPKPGIFVAEIEGLKLKSDLPNADELYEITKSYKVSQPRRRCTLVKKR